VSDGFDRVKPREPRHAGQTTASGRDAQGKRALFSSAADGPTSGVGSALIECSRCNEQTAMTLGKAVRAAMPSLHLGIRFGHGDGICSMTVLKRNYPTYMRCPACGRPSWVRLTFQV
jgi:hypothetical protein